MLKNFKYLLEMDEESKAEYREKLKSLRTLADGLIVSVENLQDLLELTPKELKRAEKEGDPDFDDGISELTLDVEYINDEYESLYSIRADSYSKGGI